MPSTGPEKIAIENVIRPGKTYQVDAAKYEAMRRAFLKVLPKRAPGLTVAEVQKAVVAHLPEELFPGGAKAGLVDEGGAARPRSERARGAREDQAAPLAKSVRRRRSPHPE